MSTLTETEYRTLRMQTLAILGEIGARDNATATAIAAGLVPAVEAILRERVAEALHKAAREVEANAGDWHGGNSQPHSYASDCAKCGGDAAARIVRESIA